MGLLCGSAGVCERAPNTALAQFRPVAAAQKDPAADAAYVPIEQVQLGQRLVGANPLTEDVELDEPDPALARTVVLEVTKPDGQLLHAELIWPVEWIDEVGASVDGQIEVAFGEIDTMGTARVEPASQRSHRKTNAVRLFKTKDANSFKTVWETSMTDGEQPNEGELILYQTQEGTVRIEVLYESETFWLSQKKIAEIFGVDLRTISHHLNQIYDSGELSRDTTLRKNRRVQQEGNREVRRVIEFYNLVMERRARCRQVYSGQPIADNGLA